MKKIIIHSFLPKYEDAVYYAYRCLNTSKEEMEEARFHRLKEGKHIIPVPTVELQPHFSGHLVNSFNLLDLNSI